MPRRPRKQPRASSGPVSEKKTSSSIKKADGKLKKWVRREDVEGDEEDQFHNARDRILLEGEDAEGGEDWGDGEEEVFGLDLEGEDFDDEDHEEEKEKVELAALDDDEEEEQSAPLNRKKTKKPAHKHTSESSGSETDDSESWGLSKSAYYASNAPLLAGKEGDEDEDEANEMEEREARRLQARIRDSMADEDYGLDDVSNVGVTDATLENDESIVASYANDTILGVPGAPLDKESVLRHLEKMSPETLALAREWDDVVRDLVRAQERLDKLESTTPDALALGLSHLHHQTLLTYVTTLAFYIRLRTAAPVILSQSQNKPPAQIKSVLARLLTLKQALATMEDLDFDASDDDDDSDMSDLDEDGLNELSRLLDSGNHSLTDINGMLGRGKEKLGAGELEALLREADAEKEGMKLRKKVRRNVGNNEELIVKPLTQKTNRIKTKQNSNTPQKTTFDLVEPKFVPTMSAGVRSVADGMELHGEATALSITDEADKKARKRSLRFHTSKIESSARRREFGREKMGGDDDIPYRERKKEAEARVRREVEKTRGEGGDDLDAEGDDHVDMEDVVALGSGKRKRDADDTASDEEREDGYYELVKRAKKERKEDKKREYEEAQMAERFDAEEDGPGGPRSLTRAILKNKGLTPRRAKTVRNPRVKKRERFEKAKKKVRSQKAVYKGDLAGKPYGGEESGITKVVKSVRL